VQAAVNKTAAMAAKKPMADSKEAMLASHPVMTDSKEASTAVMQLLPYGYAVMRGGARTNHFTVANVTTMANGRCVRTTLADVA
jgi:hypothetical protein